MDRDTEFVIFTGAVYSMAENSEYKPLGAVYLNPDRIAGFYDHTVLADGHKIRVMENLDEIRRKLRRTGL